MDIDTSLTYKQITNPTALDSEQTWRDASGQEQTTNTLSWLNDLKDDQGNYKVNGGMLLAKAGTHTALLVRDTSEYILVTDKNDPEYGKEVPNPNLS